MATINGSCDNSRYSLTCEYSYSQNTSANTSTITANVYLNGNGYTTSSSYWSCVINDTTVTSNKNASIGGRTLLGSRTWTVNHASDGTCRTTISFSYSNGLSSAGTYTTKRGSGSATVTLNTIPRSSSFTLNRSSATIGSDDIVVNISRASSSFTHTITYKFGSINWVAIEKTTATSYSFVPHINDSSQIPNSASGTATIIVDTYNGNSKIGSASRTITLNVPSNIVPSIGSVTTSGNNLLGGIYVAGKSIVTAKINSASGNQGSTIKSYSLSGAGISSSSSSATSGVLSAGSHTITGKVTDSRGRSASKTANITVHSYYAPSLSIEVYRCNSDGTRNDSGTYVRAYINQTVHNIGNANVNVKQYKIEWKRASASDWTVYKDWTNINGYEDKWTQDLGDGWDNSVTYEVRVSIKDSYNTVNAVGSVGTISCLFNIERGGVGVGKPHERGALDIGGTVYTTASFRASGNGKEAQVGTGASDVWLHNSKSGKYLQLKDDGTLKYSDNWVYHSGQKPTPADIGAIQAGNWRTNGGQDLLVHNKRALVGTTDGTLHLGYGGDFSRIVCGNGHPIYHEGNKPPLRAEAGGTVISIYPYGGWTQFETWNSSGGTAKRLIWQAWSGDGGSFRPDHDGTIYLGANDRRWYAVFASTGTISTSDIRYKSITGHVDTEDCFEMVKNTDVKNYVMLQKSKEEMDTKEFRREAKTLSQLPESTQMGVIAQEIEKYKCSKYILVHNEYEDEEGNQRDIYGINNYAFTSAIMGALQEEIKRREALEERLRKLEEKLNNI